jgi:putative endonuclease
VGRNARGALGNQAEQVALRFLLRQGLKPVTRNFRRRGGEIDLIMLHEDCLTFIEVRCRRSTRFSSPALTVDRHKQQKILRTAAMFVADSREFAHHTMRFDVLAITGRGDASVEWIRDAFRPSDSTL